MKTLLIVATGVLLAVPAGTALAQSPEKFDMEGAIRKVGELLRESERLMVECLRPGGPSKGASETARAAEKKIDDLLSEAKRDGETATDLMAEILKNAPQRRGGGSGGRKSEKPPEDDRQKEKGKEEKPEKKDPKNSKKGEPESAKKTDEQTTGLKKKPKSETGKEADPDPLKDWVTNLPPEVRKAFENRDWDKIPQKWREYIREYMKALAETEGD